MDPEFHYDSGVYILRTTNFFFLATVKLDGWSDTHWSYQINCIPTPSSNPDINPHIPEKPCVDLMINLSRDKTKHGDIPKLEIFEHNEKCSLVGSLPRGAGTRQMLMATLALAFYIFGQERFYLQDQSEVLCKNHAISLRDYSLLSRGQTWYARHFGASPIADDLKQELSKYKTKLQERIVPTQAVALSAAINNVDHFTIEERDAYLDIVKRASHEEKTWNNMFRDINPTGKDGCSFFRKLIVRTIHDLLGLEPVKAYGIVLNRQKAKEYLKDYKQIF